ncbi:unnamed protein product [Medioppia subpectinata]|nr:unnamed protein product [Medioppia subpectinata]CAG2117820.1 unnamed protein product [Medioppia subpectinata]
MNSGTAPNPTCVAIKSSDHYKISDFQSLCLTFPELTATQLQSIFEQCGNDFQRTIDRVLMNKWSLNDTDCKSSLQMQNNNDWSAATTTSSSMCGDYASNCSTHSPFIRSPLPSLMPPESMSTNFYNTSSTNGEHCYDWRSNSSSGALNDDLSNSDYGNDYYYDQSSVSCSVMSTQGNSQAMSANWNYDYTGYWHNNLQGSNGNNGSYDMSTGSHTPEDMTITWPNGQTGPLALGQAMHEYNI